MSQMMFNLPLFNPCEPRPLSRSEISGNFFVCFSQPRRITVKRLQAAKFSSTCHRVWTARRKASYTNHKYGEGLGRVCKVVSVAKDSKENIVQVSTSPPEERQHSLGRFKSYFPILEWLPKYTLETGRYDLVAGVTVACTLVPQALAYAALANLPPVYGLYTGLVPQLLYAVLGTAREAAIGPVAVVYLLVGAASRDLPAAQQIQAGVLLALVSGLMNFTMGVLKLGCVVDFLSHAVVTGFMMGAGITIFATQVKNIVGMKIPEAAAETVLGTLYYLATHLSGVRWVVFAWFAASMATLLICKALSKGKRKVPGPLVLLLLATLASKLLSPDIAIVGSVPRGLPGFAVPTFTPDLLVRVLPNAASVALLGYLEGISVAKNYSRKNGYKVRPSQELIAIGAANTIGSFFSAAPCSVSLSRTAVNAEAGAKTQMTKFVSGSMVLLTLLFAAPMFYHLPQVVLAAIICMAVSSLFDIPELRFMYKVNKQDFWLALFTTAVVVLCGVEHGMFVAIGASLLLVAFRIFRPRLMRLGRLAAATPDPRPAFADVSLHRDAIQPPGVRVYRLQAPLCFLNVTFLEDTILDEAEGARAVVLDVSCVADVDTAGVHMLKQLVVELHKVHCRFILAAPSEHLLSILRPAGVLAAMHPSNVAPSLTAALSLVPPPASSQHPPQSLTASS